MFFYVFTILEKATYKIKKKNFMTLIINVSDLKTLNFSLKK